jgi:hypothetical protein
VQYIRIVNEYHTGATMATKKEKQTEALDTLFPSEKQDELLAAGEASIEKGVTEPESDCEHCDEVGPPISVEEAIKLLSAEVSETISDLKADVEVFEENLRVLVRLSGDCVEHCNLLGPLQARVEKLKSVL